MDEKGEIFGWKKEEGGYYQDLELDRMEDSRKTLRPSSLAV